MKKSLSLLVVLGALAIYGCGGGKTAADAAIATAETAFNATKEKAMQIAPDQAKSVEDAISAAKASVEKGDYAAALTAAKDLPGQVKSMVDSLGAKESALHAQLDAMKDLPAQVGAFKSQVEKFSAMKHLPKGMNAASLQSAKDGLAQVTAAWGEIKSAMDSGNLAEAASKLEPLKKLLAAAMSAIGMPVPAMLAS